MEDTEMPTQTAATEKSINLRIKSVCALGAIATILFFAAPFPINAQANNNSGATGSGEHSGIGFTASKDASAKDVGLPWYPGARRSKETPNDDSPSVQFGFWSGSSAFKLVVLKLESSDAPGKVQAFYRNALARYGPVVICSGSSSAASHSKQSGSKMEKTDQLDCESDKPESNEAVLKAGTKHNQHLVGITPRGTGSTFQLVYVQTPKSDD
jgi:hypothetical protein